MSRKVISLVLLISVVCIVFSGCQRLVKFNFTEDGKLTDGRNFYKYAPSGYEPTFQGDVYGVIKETLEENLYRIGTNDPMDWLTTEYSGLATLVYYNENIPLPGIMEMNPGLCYICEQDSTSMSIYTVGEKGQEEQAVIDYLIAASSDESAEEEIWPRTDCSSVYHLKFYSDDYPAIYYNMIFAYNSSDYYLYDCVTKRCVRIENVLAPYYENTFSEN